MRTRHACLIACLTLLAGPAHAGGQGETRATSPSRTDRLATWLTAVEQHQSGSADASVLELRTWSRESLYSIWLDVGTIVSLIRDPDIGIFFAPVEPQPFVPPSRQTNVPGSSRVQRPTQIMYSRRELTELRVMARDVAARGGENRLLKRGAVLHADVAMLAPAQGTAYGGVQRGPRRITLYVTDGQQAGLEDAASHWEMGRRLLDKVRPALARDSRPDPASDMTVRAWYLAASSYLQSITQMDPWHVERSLQLFPRDAEILFLAACLHETLSSPQFQIAMQAIDVPRDLVFDIESEGAELREAERLFRRSLEAYPERAEARIRLGRVLGRRGRHEEAARELRQAVAETGNRLLLYYGNMFLGAEVEALGRADEARQAYERAGALYPLAQSPRLALSALATRSGDRAAALEAIETVLHRGSVDQADDPWWDYFVAQARGTDALLADLYRLVNEEVSR